MVVKNQYQKRNPPPTRVDLEPAEFDALVEDFGTVVRVTPSMVCPRRSGSEIERADVNHDLACPLCFGTIMLDMTDKSWQVSAFMQGIKLDRVFDQASRFDIKDALMTFKSHDRVSYGYKLELVDFQSIFNEVILRRDADSDKLRYGALEPQDGTYYLLVDAEGTRYLRDEGSGGDYTVTDGVLTWTGANRPETGKLYTIIYPILPTFRVLEFMHETRHYYYGFRKPKKEPVQLPQQAHIRWDYLLKRGSDVLIEKGP